MFGQHEALVEAAAAPPRLPLLMHAIRQARTRLKLHNHSSVEAAPRPDYNPAITPCGSPSMVRHTPSQSTSSRIHEVSPKPQTIRLRPTTINRSTQQGYVRLHSQDDFQLIAPSSPLIRLTVEPAPYRVSPKSPLTAAGIEIEVDMSFSDGIRAIATDSHFLVPFFVLLAGIALLVVLH